MSEKKHKARRPREKEQIRKENKIFLTENEPDAELLKTYGYKAVSTGSATQSDLTSVIGEYGKELLADTEIILAYSSDPAGLSAVKKLGPQFLECGCKLKILMMDRRDEFPEGLDPDTLGDDGKRKFKYVRDLFYQHGGDGTAGQIFEKLLAITPYEETQPVQQDSNPLQPSRKDATQTAEAYIGNISRIIFKGSDFYIWNGHFYQLLHPKTIEANIYKYLQGAGSMAFNIRPGFVKAVIGNLMGYCFVDANINQRTFISDPNRDGELLPFRNGILDLKAYIDNPGTPLISLTDDFFTVVSVPYDYDPTACCTAFPKFLDDILPNAELQMILQEMYGYCLTDDLRYHKMFILIGEGGNGKSVILDILKAMLGDGNVSSLPLERLGERFQLAITQGKFANLSPEIGHLDRTNEGLLKALISGDPVVYERKFNDSVTEVPTTHMVFGANFVPKFYDKSQGIWRRLIIIPFDISIPEERQDRELAKRIIATELPGILNWSLQGLRRLRKQGKFTVSSKSDSAKEQHQVESSSARLFLTEKCVAIVNCAVDTTTLYNYYSTYCHCSGLRALSIVSFGKELKKVFPDVVKTRITGSRGYKYSGIKYCFDGENEPKTTFIL